MGMIQLIIGAWTLLMIFVLCFEDCRAYLKNIVESLMYEWNSLYKDAKMKGNLLGMFLDVVYYFNSFILLSVVFPIVASSFCILCF